MARPPIVYEYDISQLTPLWPMNKWQFAILVTGVSLFLFGWLVWPGR